MIIENIILMNNKINDNKVEQRNRATYYLQSRATPRSSPALLGMVF
jgi:hypothetical protein